MDSMKASSILVEPSMGMPTKSAAASRFSRKWSVLVYSYLESDHVCIRVAL